MMNNANTYSGPGDTKVAFDLYCSAIQCEARSMRREGVYVCLANLLKRLPAYNSEVLTSAFWALSINGQL